MMNRDIQKVCVVGAGVIGASWTTYFLSQKLDVMLVDPNPDALAAAQPFIDNAFAHIRKIEEAPLNLGQLDICASIDDIDPDIDFVQECGPEKLEWKQNIFMRLDAKLPSDVVMVSSTSSLLPSDLQSKCSKHPERVLVAHPFNPPHLLPLVELVGGKKTSTEAIEAALSFFERIGKTPIIVKKEMVGHLANRLSSALWREAVHLVAEGFASVEDVDKAITNGPGLRLAVMGPHMLYHLGGGQGGMKHYLDHLGDTQVARWKELGNPVLSDQVKEKLVAGVLEEAAGASIDELSYWRDEKLLEILKNRN